jgi:hypothetical protein
MTLIDSMHMDCHPLYLMTRSYEEFYGYDGKSGIFTGFIGTSLYSVMSTFDPCHMFTRSMNPKYHWTTLLGVCRNKIYAPRLPLFITIVYTIWVFDLGSMAELTAIHKIESETGYGPHSSAREAGEIRFDIEIISHWLRKSTRFKAIRPTTSDMSRWLAASLVTSVKPTC